MEKYVQEGNQKIEWICGLKGFCAVTVVLLHLLACFFVDALLGAETISRLDTYNFITYTPFNIFFNGSFSVYIFWTISAFLITKSWNFQHESVDLFRKILKKYFRILLPVIVCSVIVFLLIKAGLYYNMVAGHITGPSFFTEERDFSTVTFHTLLADLLWNDFFTGAVTLITPLWTMKIELFGCCLTAFLLICFANYKYRNLLLLVIAIILTGKHAIPYLCFITGIFLADYSNHVRKNLNVLGVIIFSLGIFFGAYPPSCIPTSGIYAIVYDLMIAKYNLIAGGNFGVSLLYVIATALVLYGLIQVDGLKKIYSNRIITFLGDRALYIYIIHMPIIFSFTAYLFTRLYEISGHYVRS